MVDDTGNRTDDGTRRTTRRGFLRGAALSPRRHYWALVARPAPNTAGHRTSLRSSTT
ncbi:hypothetical protein ACFQL1_17300 [Halomicroarcula sp. GCM10025709]|uniref:hypothetical protein n=1 Tax=Halomicroarcula sp. GCM10025709 TaxID=3252669 RepID=UPI00362135AC